MKTISEIDLRRKELGISIPELCASAGINHSTYYKQLNSSQSKPSAKTVEALSKALDMHLAPSGAKCTDTDLASIVPKAIYQAEFTLLNPQIALDDHFFDQLCRVVNSSAADAGTGIEGIASVGLEAFPGGWTITILYWGTFAHSNIATRQSFSNCEQYGGISFPWSTDLLRAPQETLELLRVLNGQFVPIFGYKSGPNAFYSLETRQQIHGVVAYRKMQKPAAKLEPGTYFRRMVAAQ
jgi:transcriptional regulator with XRE-family HTH domain